ncbi:hypothetical protein NDU88_006400 [Pleurodeles waltl]|uniref:Uncharacterized protein n=1 Tax=Pleurodeles waltl TaxID=8319 RepID=A0AAV7NZ81_PLEWA|nr:hypothetical protein NDU88_006400 [Pleurodeles waltl]
MDMAELKAGSLWLTDRAAGEQGAKGMTGALLVTPGEVQRKTRGEGPMVDWRGASDQHMERRLNWDPRRHYLRSISDPFTYPAKSNGVRCR